MIREYTEEDFYELKMVSISRLRPDGVSVFCLGAFIFSAIFTVICINAVASSSYITNPIYILVVRIEVILLVIQLPITVFFNSVKNAFRFQKFQAIFLCIVSLRVSIEMYQFYFLACEDKQAPSYMINIGLLLLLGGVVYLVLLIIRVMQCVKEGKLRRGGRYLYNFSNSKFDVALPIIYGITMIAGGIARIVSNTNSVSSKFAGLIISLVLATIIQYGMAMAFPEFFLLTYCKFRFESFKNKMPKAWLERSK